MCEPEGEFLNRSGDNGYDMVLVRALTDLEPITDLDGRVYDLARGDTVTLSYQCASAGINRGIFAPVSVPQTKPVLSTVPDIPSTHELVCDELERRARQEERKLNAETTYLDNREQERNHQTALDTVCMAFPKTDLGNSDRLIRRYGHVIKFSHNEKMWYIWDGISWKPDFNGKIMRVARDTALQIGNEAGKMNGDMAISDMFKWAGASQNGTRIKMMVELAKIPETAVPETGFDSDPSLLNFQNGTLNLKTFEFHRHCREDMLSMVMGCEYDSGETCPKWKAQMNLIFEKNEEMIHFFQELCGYHFLADHPMQCMFMHHGDGQNGRSVVFHVLEMIFGDYAGPFPTELLLYSKFRNIGSVKPQPELLTLVRKRFLIAKETDKGQILSEDSVKKFTGGDTSNARLCHSNRMERFRGILKINLVTNYLPRVRGTDKGIQRRLVKIPYMVKIPEETRRPFDEVVAELIAEAPGIINWMVEGYHRVLENRKMVALPETVKTATFDYIRKEDVFGRWLADECYHGNDIESDNCLTPTAATTQYKAWADREGEVTLSTREIREEMVRRFGEPHRNKNKRYYSGIRLLNEKEKKTGEIEKGTEQVHLRTVAEKG